MRERDDLPLPDYDQLQVGSLTSRIRTLGADDLQTLIDYERSHAKRVQVMAVMENRLTSLKAGAQPSGGDPPRPHPSRHRPRTPGRRPPRRRPDRRSTRRPTATRATSSVEHSAYLRRPLRGGGDQVPTRLIRRFLVLP